MAISRPLRSCMVALLVLAPWGAARAQEDNNPGAEDHTLRILDLRDLSYAGRSDSLSDRYEKQRERVLETLTNALGMIAAHPLAPGVFAAEADKAQHEALTRALNEYRALARERYSVTTQLVRVDAAKLPQIGAPAAAFAESLLEQRSVAKRLTPLAVTSLMRSTYVARLSPIVAEASAAYETEVAVLEEGLQLSIVVGAGPSDQQSSVSVNGSISRGNLARKSGSMVAVAGPSAASDRQLLQIDLPTVSTRSLTSDLVVTHGQPTVMCVIDGFESGEHLALLVSVAPLP